MGFWVILVHPTVVSVLLSASVERCFVSRMRDLKKKYIEKPLNVVFSLNMPVENVNLLYLYKAKMRLGVRLGNLSRLVLRLEVCLLQAKGLCSGSDIIFPSTLLRLGLGNKSEACPSVELVIKTWKVINYFKRNLEYN